MGGCCQHLCPALRDPVCASDGKTYKSECKFEFAKCKANKRGEKLEIVSHGRCKTLVRPDCDSEVNRAKGGKAYAKSELSFKPAAEAFAGPKEVWHSKSGMPQWLLYELKEPLPICKISFNPRMDDYRGFTANDCPKSYRFEGSNNNLTFTTLLTINDANVDVECVSGRTITRWIPREKVSTFTFYRFYVEDVQGRIDTITGVKYVVFGNLQFFSSNVITKKPTTAAAPSTKPTNGKTTTKLATTSTTTTITTTKRHSDPSSKKYQDTTTTTAAETTTTTTTKIPTTTSTTTTTILPTTKTKTAFATTINKPSTTVAIVTVGNEYKKGERDKDKNEFTGITIIIAVIALILIATGVSVKVALVMMRRRRRRQAKEAVRRRQQRQIDLQVENGVKNGVEIGVKNDNKNGEITNPDTVVYSLEFDSTAGYTDQFSGASGVTSGTTNVSLSKDYSSTRTTSEASSSNQSNSTTTNTQSSGDSTFA